MAYCPKCGSLVMESDRFCSKCGMQLNNQTSTIGINVLSFRFPAKPSTNFVNGLFTGVGLTLIIVGVMVASGLNSFWQQTNGLTAQGISYYPRLTIVSLISGGALMTFLGIYLTVLSVFVQLNPKLRNVWNGKNSALRAANGLIVFGFLFASLTSLNIITGSYLPNLGGFKSVNLVLVIVGLLVMLGGISLLARSYLKSNNPAKKV